MTFSFNDLMQPMTREELRKSHYDVLGILGVNTTKWKPGSVLRTMIYASSAVLAGLSQVIVGVSRGGYRELARGAWLRLNAQYVYGVPPLDADFASGNLVLSNSGGGVYNNVQPGDFISRNPETNKQYRNTAEFSIAALQSGVVVPMQAIEAGSASTSGAGEITELVTAMPGVTCTNLEAFVGVDTEREEDLRLRSGESLGALSPNGAADAYGFIVRSAKRDDGTTIGVNRVRAMPDGNGGIAVHCATPSGAVPAPDVAILNTRVQRACEPLGIDAEVFSATTVTQAVTYTIYCTDTDTSDADIIAAADAAVTAFLSTYPIGGVDIDSGGKLYVSAVQSAIGAVQPNGVPLGVVRVVVTAPAADVALSINQAPVAGTLTGAVVRVRVGQL
jgi:phage-related baseplate assembly protein